LSKTVLEQRVRVHFTDIGRVCCYSERKKVAVFCSSRLEQLKDLLSNWCHQ